MKVSRNCQDALFIINEYHNEAKEAKNPTGAKKNQSQSLLQFLSTCHYPKVFKQEKL